jgi:Domain of unknown function (DUF1918)
MRARVGDWILISGHRAGQPMRDCEVLEVRHRNGEPPYLVRWGDTHHEDLFLPGPDAAILNSEHKRGSRVGPFSWTEPYWWGYR